MNRSELIIKKQEATTGRVPVLLRVVNGKPSVSSIKKDTQKFIKEFKSVITHNSSKAIHIDWVPSVDGFWLPKSQIEWKGELGQTSVTSPPTLVYIPKWLWNKIDVVDMV